MNDLKILLKNNFNMFIGSLQGKKKRKSFTVSVLLLVLGIVAIIGLYSFQAYAMFDGLNKIGLSKVCVFHGILTSLSVVVIIGLMRVAWKTKTEDSDLLLSLPIKKSSIIIAKTVNKYLFDLFFAFVLFMPYSVLYLIYNGFNISVLLCSISVVLFLPLLSIGISYIFNFIITRIFCKFKSEKLLKSIFSVLLYIVVIGLMLIKTYTYGTADPNNLEAYFADRFFSNTILKFVLEQNLFSTIFFFGLTIIPFVVGMILYSLNFGKTFSKYTNYSKKLKFLSPKSTLTQLYKKELSTYVTTPAWFVNTIIGPVMMLAFTILFLTSNPSKVLSSLGISANSPELIYSVLILIFCGLISTTQISCCSVSLEGKQLWILKSCPINEKKLLLSKSLLQFSVIEPFILVCSTVLSIILKLNFFGVVMLIVIPTLLALISSFAGVLINIYHPKLDFDDETKVVKQSLSVLLSMVFTFVLTLIPVAIYLIFSTISLNLLILITLAFYIVVLTFVIIFLFTKGAKQFLNLQN